MDERDILAAVVPGRPGGDLSDQALVAKSPLSRSWQLTLIGKSQRFPAMLDLTWSVRPALPMRFFPGQDLTVTVGQTPDRVIRRRYTIRGYDEEQHRLDIQVYLHGSGIGARWADRLREGDTASAIGPRGKLGLDRDALGHVFVGDETAVPAMAVMNEAIVPGTALIIGVVRDPRAWRDFETTMPWHWLEDDRRLRDLAADFLAELPASPGQVHAYLAGEARELLRWRDAVSTLGLGADQISAKAYWGRGRPNATHGEPT